LRQSNRNQPGSRCSDGDLFFISSCVPEDLVLTTSGMTTTVTYRNLTIGIDESAVIQQLIRDNPTLSRRALSQRLCRLWNWTQPNGVLRDMVCRGLLLQAEKEGLVALPPRKCHPPNPFVTRTRPSTIEIDQSPFQGSLSSLGPLEFRLVRRTPLEKLSNGLIAQYHYLGYSHPVGEQLKYLVFSDVRPVACFSFSSAPRHIGCRDRFIGWDQATRRKKLSLVATNTRFLILPWFQVPFLASHLLGQVVRRLSGDWEKQYNHPVVYLETFVDTERFAGTCYRAANWLYLGQTTGRGKNDQTNRPNRSLKAVFGYPLRSDFREVLCDATA
jgi:hypothetical protein